MPFNKTGPKKSSFGLEPYINSLKSSFILSEGIVLTSFNLIGSQENNTCLSLIVYVLETDLLRVNFEPVGLRITL